MSATQRSTVMLWLATRTPQVGAESPLGNPLAPQGIHAMLCYTNYDMNDELLEDLRLLIDARLSQSETSLRTEIHDTVAASEERLRVDLQRVEHTLEHRMDEGFAGVGDAIETLVTDIDHRLTKHDQRLDDHDRRLGKPSTGWKPKAA